MNAKQRRKALRHDTEVHERLVRLFLKYGFDTPFFLKYTDDILSTSLRHFHVRSMCFNGEGNGMYSFTNEAKRLITKKLKGEI